MQPFWMAFLLLAVIFIVWVWFGDIIMAHFKRPISRQARTVRKEIVTAARFGGLTAKRREISFQLEDKTVMTFAVGRRIFETCPYRRNGLLTWRGRCFWSFEYDNGRVGKHFSSE